MVRCHWLFSSLVFGAWRSQFGVVMFGVWFLVLGGGCLCVVVCVFLLGALWLVSCDVCFEFCDLCGVYGV